VLNVYNAAQPGLQATQGQINTRSATSGHGSGLAAQTGAFGATAGKANGFRAM
jgi:hypothetical protein